MLLICAGLTGNHWKIAVVSVAPAIDTLQVGLVLPLHASNWFPLPQPVNVWPLAGVAVSVTEVPEVNVYSQSEVHALMPVGMLETEPGPETSTVSTAGSFQLAGGTRSHVPPVLGVGI
jgi:hypothetical protein